MKYQMKLRTRLFLGFSALMTVALCGLLLALFSVMQMAKSQEYLAGDDFSVIEVNQKLRQSLSSHIVILLDDSMDNELLGEARGEFRNILAEAMVRSRSPDERQAYQRISDTYEEFNDSLEAFHGPAWGLPESGLLGQTFLHLRQLMVDMQDNAHAQIRNIQKSGHERALLLAGLLGLTGIAVLLVGFITAHSFARHFGEPIERLASAADQIGQGNFDLRLPSSPIAELTLLIRRFGLMAAAMDRFKQTNVQALLNGQQRLQALLDSIDDGLLIIDRQGNLEHANPVAQRQLALGSGYLGSRLGLALGHAQLDAAAQRVLEDKPLIAPQDDLVIEADGERRLLAWRMIPVSHNDGHISGAVMVLRDVTDQRDFERVRNEFVLRASHELRTPVTGMQMAFSLLRERTQHPPGSRESDLFDTVHEEMQRLVSLINDLLNFSRYQSGQQKLDLRPGNIGQLLEEARQRFLPAAQAGGIDLRLDLTETLPEPMIDLQQMDRLLDNLLSNAIRHTAHGGEVKLMARHHGQQVTISVEDSGEGIPYSQQARIFEPFVQIGRRKGGAGLGLALCKEIAQLHGGRIGVHSRTGHGTLFYVSLPA
ncbi:PAS domain-containing sensor histidine kinase [Stutzerimonas kirkiae]|uniref:histidine kinase n=1 Tax=Stutzerimonas kirkiae TaxID=2211392 RepID=A0A4Q9RDQ8_9GAMM|nr:ATP-binding protein [Stutzerimonas kirkiae]TBU99348.1 PAS domain-containing sensor histidine kinase [Stutzerimonas kirkiae]TBV06192.1 PAS domain-containing sensor histidine kinase [Stutzerimonas kirkiae]